MADLLFHLYEDYVDNIYMMSTRDILVSTPKDYGQYIQNHKRNKKRKK